MSSQTTTASPRQIVWTDLDKSKYYFWGCTVFLGIRLCVYPTNLIKTRLQVQRGTSVYRGSFDAFIKVFKSEGILGFYRGFPIFALGVFFGQVYITTYEYAKHRCNHLNVVMQGLLPGAVASVAGQTLSVPADVVTQRLQILGMLRQKEMPSSKYGGTVATKSADHTLLGICRKIMVKDGLSGFYRGYLVSLMSNVPTSGIWWATYNCLLSHSGRYVASDTQGHHRMPVQAVSGVMSGIISAVATNPLDIIRTRIQVGGSRSVVYVTRKLWAEDGMGLFVKGLSARALSMSTSSFLIILGYETVKRLSLKQQGGGNSGSKSEAVQYN